MNTKCVSLIAGALLASVSLSAAVAEERKPLPPRPEAGAPEPRHAGGPLPGTQQYKMKVCNQEASKKALRGQERRAFMSQCLKG